jgi:hypothetical protein
LLSIPRLEAMKRLGKAKIKIFDDPQDVRGVEMELWEIDENLIRNELSPMERAQNLARRKAILEARGDVQEHGGDRRSSPQLEDLKSFADKTAEDLGVSHKSIERDVRRAANILPDVQNRDHQYPSR